MRFLSVADRELRAAARRPGLHRLRWLTAAAFSILLLWMAWAFSLFTQPRAGPQVFQGFSVMIFLYCLLVGATGAADTISRERREGTLGLLFLTNLNSAEIVAGKLCSSILGALYPVLAIGPLLALPMLVGGITEEQFGRTLLALLSTLFFAVTMGLIASAVSVRQFPAIALATGLALILGMAPVAVAGALRSVGYPKLMTDYLAACCPLHALNAAQSWPRAPGGEYFWFSLVSVAGMLWVSLMLIAWRLRRSWQDLPKNGPLWTRFGWMRRWRDRGRHARAGLRRRFLDINPLFWLASRGQIGSPVFMLVTVVVAGMAVGVVAPTLERSLGAGAFGPVEGLFFAWLLGTLALHLLVLSYGAAVASQTLAEDRKSGALELILCTSTSERTLSRGLWRAFGRRMFFPILVAVLAHLFLIWLGGVLVLLDPPEPLPSGITPAQLLWHAWSNQPFAGTFLNWQVGFMLRLALTGLGMLLAAWLTLGWLGRWLGLSLKHPGFAPLISVAAILVPPALLFALVCYLFDDWGLDRLPERRFLPLMLGIAGAISLGNCLLLSVWAQGRLRQDFRAIATGSLEPRRFWWLPRRNTVIRLSVTVGALLAAFVLLALGFYGSENWRSRRDWQAFQQELKQRGESLELAALLPGPVPEDDNFARSPIFQQLVRGTELNTIQKRLWNAAAKESRENFDPSPSAWRGNEIRRQSTDFTTNFAWVLPLGVKMSTNRQQAAVSVYEGLKPLETELGALAEASRRTGFQLTTNRQYAVVFDTDNRSLAVLEPLEFLFRIRASTRLVMGETEAAGEDVLTCLRLAGFARQSPDANSTVRTQSLLYDALQPLWEGVVLHRWTEPQLAAFQTQLEQFPLLADYTNAVRRIVLAHVESWLTPRETDRSAGRISVPGGQFLEQEEVVWQPSGWWLDHCLQLYQAGQTAVANVEVGTGRVSTYYLYSELNGLPLGNQTAAVLQAEWWSPNPKLFTFAQCSLNQAILACALERYRLTHGDYPSSLAQLVPRFLNQVLPDVPHGRPMHYQRESRDRYVLRGFGSNGVNDQDKPRSDDWLWAFPVIPTNAPSDPSPRLR
ncbi:MAG: ABC transporter permease subunit [Verrucomicrobia bacterium]|nr:ABC transporter permease subunit [Verrucomicrobiota bacterium]